MQKVLSTVTTLVSLLLAALTQTQTATAGAFNGALLALAAYTLASGIVGLLGGPPWLKALIADIGALIRKNDAPKPEDIPKPPATPTVIPPLPLILLVLALSGCAGSFETMRSQRVPSVRASVVSEHCAGLDSDRALFSGLAKGAEVAAGTTGLSAIPDSDRGVRLSLAIGTVISAGAALLFETLSSSKASSWVRECSQ